MTQEQDRVVITCEAAIVRRGGEARIVRADGGDVGAPARPDAALIKAMARAEDWKRQIGSGAVRTVGELAAGEGFAADYVLRVLRLAFLAPDLKRAVLEGRAPAGLTLQAIIKADIPDAWERQRQVLRAGRGNVRTTDRAA